MIEAINIRFFCYYMTEDGVDIMEIDEQKFLELGGEISYDRNTVFQNGVRQVCLTTSEFMEFD